MVALMCISSAEIAYGVAYQPLVGLPQLEGSGQGLGGYLNQLYMAVVAVGAILAFLKIAFAGAKWSLSEVVTDKSTAKEDIKGALLGLAILLVPFIVLNTIYDGLTNLNVLQGTSVQKVRDGLKLKEGAGGPGGATTPAPTPAPASGLEFGTQPVIKNYTGNDLGCALAVTSPVSGEMGGTGMYVCDMTAARASCSGLNGTFTVTSREPTTGIETASCSYLEVTAPSTAACQMGGPC